MAEAKVTAVIEAQDKASGPLGAIGGNFNKLAITLAGVTAAAAVVYKGFQAVVASSAEAQVKIASMDATLKAAGDTTLKTRESILAASAAFTKLGLDDEEAAKSMAILFQRTKDVGKAMELTRLSADLARARNIDLAQATNLVSLALSGQGRALAQYGIQIKDSATPLEALAELQKVVGGQAEAFSKTLTGQGEVLAQTWDDFKQLIGDQLIPVLTTLLRMLTSLIETIPNVTKAVKDWWVEVDKATGLGAVFKMLWDSIATTFNENLLPALRRLWEALKPLQPFLEALGTVIGVTLVGAIILLANTLTLIINGFTMLLTIAANVATFFTNVLGGSINFVIDKISTLINWVKQAIDWLGKLSFSSVGSAIGGVASKVGGALPNPFGGNGFKLPGFAEGGIVPGAIGAPMLAVVHGGERVIPNGGSGLGNVNITITGNSIASNMDLRYIAEEVGREVMRSLKIAQRI